MSQEQGARSQPLPRWVWLCIALVIVLLITGWDPMAEIFGQQGGRWIVNLIFIAAIIYAFVKKR